MSIHKKRTILWVVLATALVASWLPYFNILNSLTWIGPLPLPLALVLFSNAVLTACAIALYPLYFKPFAMRMSEKEKWETPHG